MKLHTLRTDGQHPEALAHELQRRTDQLHALAEVAAAVNTARSFSDVMQLITDRARLVIGAHQAVTSFCIGHTMAQSIGGLSLSEKYAAYRSFDAQPEGLGVIGIVCESNRPVRMTQAELESHPEWRGFGKHAGKHPPMRGWLAAPLISSDGTNLGVIQLSDRFEGDFTQQDQDILVQFAQMASAALELRQARDDLQSRVRERTAELQRANEELQSEIAERKHAEATLRASEERFRNVLEISRDIIYRFHLKTLTYEYVSPSCLQMLGYRSEDLLAGGVEFVTSLIHPDDRSIMRAYLDRILSGSLGKDVDSVVEYRFLTKHLGYRWLSDSRNTVYDAGEPVAIVGNVRDVTERRRAEEDLDRFFRLSLDMFCVAGTDGYFKRLNPAWEKTLGYSLAELLNEPFSNFIHPDDRAATAAEVAKLAAGQEVVFFENRYRSKDGSYRWLRWTGAPFTESQHIYAAARDVTESKLADEKLLAEEKLLRQLLDLHERERRLIAYEIHDGFLQYSVGAKMLIEAVAHEMHASDDAPLEEFEAVECLLDKAVTEGREMIGNLRPLILDEQGIVGVINYLIAERKKRGKTEFAFSHDVTFDRLHPLLEGTLFRIVQEALNNIGRHSQAERAEIRLSEGADQVHLEISDDGVGFDFHQVPESHFGLRSIMERARLFKGTAAINSSPGRGTRIAVSLPITPKP